MSAGKNIDVRIAATGGDQAATEINKVGNHDFLDVDLIGKLVTDVALFRGLLDGYAEEDAAWASQTHEVGIPS